MSDRKRVDQAKIQLIEILDEMNIWLDEMREDTFCAELFNFSWRAAELAAILGFDQPPFEHVPLVSPQDYFRFNDIREQAVQTKVSVHSPFGMHGLHFGFTRPLGEALIAQSNSRLHADLRACIGQWRRAVQRLDAASVKPAGATLVLHSNSLEAEIFEQQRLRELAGDPTSFCEEMQSEVAETLRVAKLEGLTPEQTRNLIAERSSLLFNESVRRRETLATSIADDPVSTEAVIEPPVVAVETKLGKESREALRRRAEKHVKDVCNNVYPGTRKLARALKCSTASLNNAIKSSAHLKARKAEYDAGRKGKATEQRLSEVHVDHISQSTEPDPGDALEELIEDQKADDRQDRRMAKTHSRRRSA